MLVGCLAVVAALLAPVGLARGGSLTVATAPSNDGSDGRLALLEGVLGGERTGGSTACFWVETDEGRTYVLWPHGWTATVDPLKAVDRQGMNGVAVGEPVEIGGAPVQDGDPTLAGCDLPPGAYVFAASDVTAVPLPVQGA